MKKILLSVLIMLLAWNSVSAQDSVRLRRNAVTTSLIPLHADGFLFTYERMLPIRSSIEVEAGGQGLFFGNSEAQITRPGFATTIGFKFYIPLGERSRTAVRMGGLPRKSLFLKARFAYVRQWASIDDYVDNEGWVIITRKRNIYENDYTGALIFGYQFVTDPGFVFSPFIGVTMPSWVRIDGPFHDIGSGTGISIISANNIVGGLKMGWSF